MTSRIPRTKRSSNRRQALHKANLLICSLVVLFIIGYTLTNHMFDKVSEMSGVHNNQLISYKIATGDTLWRIASKSITADEDVRDKIIAIQKLNNMSATQALSPGQIIMIPVASASIDQHRYALMSR